MRTPRVLSLAATIFFGLTSSVGCATGSLPANSAPSISPQPSQSVTDLPAAGSTASPTPHSEGPTAADLNCDSMLEPVVSIGLRSRGLSPAQKPWTQFGFIPSALALECPWGVAGASAPETYYGWARLEHGQDAHFVALVQENGYIVEQTSQGVWVVAPPDLVTGASVEILVTPGWVAYAETRDAVYDIVWTN